MDQTRNMIIAQINKGLRIKNIESKEKKKNITKRKNGRSNIVDKDQRNSFNNLFKNNSLFKLMMRIFLLYQI